MQARKKRPLRIFLCVLGGLAAALTLTFVTLMYLIPAFETVDAQPVAGSSDWMRALDDEKYISEVVLPGTHDSATTHAQLAFFSKCQALDIREQLEAGFRYLDMRLVIDGDRLKLMHGFVNCTESDWPWSASLKLDAVLEDCYAFLDAHPSEFIVFTAKSESGSRDAARVAALLDGYIEKRPDRWLCADRIPQVGDARGKLVLLRRWQDGAGLDVEWIIPQVSSLPDTAAAEFRFDGYSVQVQDYFELNADNKWTVFLAGLAETKPDAQSIAIHFLSTKGTLKFGHPHKYAKPLNTRLLEETPTLSGWIIVDFGSPLLAKQIYDTNFAP